MNAKRMGPKKMSIVREAGLRSPSAALGSVVPRQSHGGSPPGLPHAVKWMMGLFLAMGAISVGLEQDAYGAIDPSSTHYYTEVDFQLSITGFRDAAGNTLASRPSDLSVVAEVVLHQPEIISLSGSGWATTYGSAYVIAQGTGAGYGPAGTLDVGDGFRLQNTAAGTLGTLGDSAISGVQMAATLVVENSSATEGYFVDFDEHSTITLEGFLADPPILCWFDDYQTSVRALGAWSWSFDIDSLQGIPNAHSQSQGFSMYVGPGGEGGQGVGIGSYGGCSSVPEPSTLSLVAALLVGRRLRRRR